MTATTVIGYGNLIDSATLAGGDWLTGIGYGNLIDSDTLAGGDTLNNLKTRYLRQPAVSDGATTAATQFTIDLGAEKTIGLLALITHNITVGSGQITLTGANDASFTEIAWRGNCMLAYAGGDFAVALPDDLAARYWKVEIIDTSNTSGYISIGRVFIGPAFAPAQGLEFNSSVGVESRAGVNEAWSGMEHFEPRRNRRVWRGQFNHLLEAEAAEWLNVCRTNDTIGEVYILEQTERTSGNLIMNPDSISIWNLYGLTASPDDTADPINGAMVADTITETATTEQHWMIHSNAFYLANSDAAANEVTLSGYIKNGSNRYPVLMLSDYGTYPNNFVRAHFDATAKTAGVLYSGGGSTITASACTDAGNGWVRCSLSSKLKFSGQAKVDRSFYFDNALDLALPNYAGDTGQSMKVFGFQINFGGLMPYIDAAHPLTIDTSGYRGARSFLGRLRALSPIEWPYINQYSTAVEISEVL